MAKHINGHYYDCFYMGVVVYNVDFKHYYDTESAAKALGVTIEEFKRLTSNV